MTNIIHEIRLNHLVLSQNNFLANAIYCLKIAAEKDGLRIYIPCHRRYKPINVHTDEYVKYEPYIESHGVIFTRDPAEFDVWDSGSHKGAYYLFGNDQASRDEYPVRLRVILPYLRPYDVS